MTPYDKLSALGSISSILGLFVSLYVLLKEIILKDELDVFKKEEETWHDEDKHVS